MAGRQGWEEAAFHTPSGSQASGLDKDADQFVDTSEDVDERPAREVGTANHTAEIATQTDSTLAKLAEQTSERAVGTYLFTTIFLVAGLGSILFIAGLSALDDDISNGCVSVVTPTGTQCLAVDFGVYFFVWLLQIVVHASMIAALYYRVWPDYRYMLNALNVICTSLEIWGVDMFLTISSYVAGSAVNAANTAAAGGIFLLMVNFALFFLLGPSDHSTVARFLRTPWKYTAAARVTSKWFKRAKRRPTDGAPETGN